jgi:hypothetical protein
MAAGEEGMPGRNILGLQTAGMVMHKAVRFLGILMAVSVLTAISGIAAAQTAAPQSDLGGTSWTASNDSCDLGVDFRSDGTADILAMSNADSDTAHWTLDGDSLHLKYDTWYGGIEGTLYGDNRIEATQAWRSKETQVVHNDPCILKRDK